MKGFFTVFLSVFVAELGDKTQVATLLFAIDPNVDRFGVFLASSGALVLSSLIAVLIGTGLSRVVSQSTLKIVAGIGFTVIGLRILATSRS